MELQRIRNNRGLKPSQLARLAGHHSVARLLSEAHIPPPHAAVPGSSELSSRRQRYRHGARPDQAHRLRMSAAPERPPMSQEAIVASIMQVLIQRLHSFSSSELLEVQNHGFADACAVLAARMLGCRAILP